MTQSARSALHYLRFARAIALASTVATAAGCSAVVVASSSDDAEVGDAADANPRGPCDCCPSGDWSGRCARYPGPRIGDAAVSTETIAPMPGRRWCTADDLTPAMGPFRCPTVGPLSPPEMTAASA